MKFRATRLFLFIARFLVALFSASFRPGALAQERTVEAEVENLQEAILSKCDAVQSYRNVLTCIGELVPIDAAAARLKVLKQEHPDAFPKVPPTDAGTPTDGNR